MEVVEVIKPTKRRKEGGGEKRTAVEMEAETEISDVPRNNSMKKKKKAIVIEEGKHIDVKEFLSSKKRDYLVSSKDGKLVPVSSLEGKYVLICCLFIPFDLDTNQGSLCQSIQVLYAHLSRLAISDFVNLLIVLNNATAVAAFDSFFSWFPLNCLTIPFWDSDSRHYLCAATSSHPCVAIHPSGLVLSFGEDFLQYYGARSFPFTRMHLEDIDRYDNLIEHAICSNHGIIIQDLLQCDHSLSQIDNNKSVPISDLTDKPVGLYLYADGSFMNAFRILHKTCRDKALNFDVVLVPLPTSLHYDVVSFCDRMKQSALEDEISSSWLEFPYDDDVCRTLYRLTASPQDELIILPHGDLRGDLDGRAVATRYGVHAYPFSKDALVKRKVDHLRSLTLDRLLGKDFTDSCHLDNKNVLLCLDYSWSSSLFKHLKKEYCKIKQQYPDCQVVLVPL